ncbi:MAG: hypothetical protein TH68_10995 [Candidatus Synechococcus spongiarum 142]|uniref:Uncharacterized protein n=1 Tax=Candidatus Synechococcus spongiarum 142 TaxID=1608213 RepID=A0A6N3X640_9SYNE|nr:MAG: hypothetical protein TH68_10995 [Candidatus Synechococcus spongiarum 142]
MLPSLPSALAEWAQPSAWGAITTLLAVNWLETKACEARLKEEIKANEARLKEEIKASEARLNQRIDEIKTDMNQKINELKADMNQQIGELRADNRALGEKMDRMLDALLAVRQT